MEPLAASLERDGYAIVRSFIGDDDVAELRSAIASVRTDDPGIRNLLVKCPEVASFAGSACLVNLTADLLQGSAFPVKATLFDKTPGANWLVPWHQDLTIAVSQKMSLSGFGPWTTKAGVVHVQPPAEVLETMVAVRVHLDDCDERNGVLRVLPGTHNQGRLSASQIEEARRRIRAVQCEVRAGDIVLMKPLLLHASSSATEPSHRRVIHVEYASRELPGGLRWAV